MIKDRLIQALKSASADYNGGMGVNESVAKAASENDFNEKQTDRLVEMFNTALALGKEKDASDPTGSCELADKNAVSRILLNGSSMKKSASCSEHDYSFYLDDPSKTNPSIEARSIGSCSIVKSASETQDKVPDELNVSQRSLYKIISEKVDILKSAADAADCVARGLRLDVERETVKVAKEIEYSPYGDEIADMFKAACHFQEAVKAISEYSTKVADSDGGKYSKMNVFDSSLVDEILKSAESIEDGLSKISEYESKRDFYLSKAEESIREVEKALGIVRHEKRASVADFFNPDRVSSDGCVSDECHSDNKGMSEGSVSYEKIAELVRSSGVCSEDVKRLADDIEKEAAALSFSGIHTNLPIPSSSSMSPLLSGPDIPEEQSVLNNVKRSIILADLMSNDPIIRDADPNAVVEAYKSLVMTSPRVSLDPSIVKAVLRSAANSVAISPADMKVVSDVDRGIAMSNIDVGRLTAIDSSIKDSNRT